VATNGENGFKINHKPRTERVKIRYKEQVKAARLLGVKKFTVFITRRLSNQHEKLRNKIARIIKQVKPEIIISFDQQIRSFEYKFKSQRPPSNSQASFDAVFATKEPLYSARKSHSVRYFYFFGTDKPNHYENITGQIK
jgi:LmbE family N-acetylglucosaminyl deacetylase